MSEPARQIDVIDARPAFTQADADALNARFEGVHASAMLKALFEEDNLGEVAVVSSFGTESAVLLHLVAGADQSIPVTFVDTLKMFPETLAYRETLIHTLGLQNTNVVQPDPAVLAQKDENGLRWSFDPDGCCEIRKVKPLEKALAQYDASITGRKGFQASTRQGLPRFEPDGNTGRIKINPLANWTREMIDAYFETYDLPRHPLESEGYPSIGCSPCTSKVKPGEDPRSGRWRGWDKTECGIHTPVSIIGDDPANEPAF